MLNKLSFAGAGFLILQCAPSAFAANEIQPGLWHDAEAAEINGKMYPPEPMTSCIKPEDAKDIVKATHARMKASIMKDKPQACGTLNIRQNGNAMLVEMHCSDPKEGSIDVSMTMTLTVNSPQSTTSVKTSKISTGGQTMVTRATTESKWLSANCDKK